MTSGSQGVEASNPDRSRRDNPFFGSTPYADMPCRSARHPLCDIPGQGNADGLAARCRSPMASSTCERVTLPENRAEPFETQHPAISRAISCACPLISGRIRQVVLARRADASPPTTSAPQDCATRSISSRRRRSATSPAPARRASPPPYWQCPTVRASRRAALSPAHPRHHRLNRHVAT